MGVGLGMLYSMGSQRAILALITIQKQQKLCSKTILGTFHFIFKIHMYFEKYMNIFCLWTRKLYVRLFKGLFKDDIV